MQRCLRALGFFEERTPREWERELNNFQNKKKKHSSTAKTAEKNIRSRGAMGKK